MPRAALPPPPPLVCWHQSGRQAGLANAACMPRAQRTHAAPPLQASSGDDEQQQQQQQQPAKRRRLAPPPAGPADDDPDDDPHASGGSGEQRGAAPAPPPPEAAAAAVAGGGESPLALLSDELVLRVMAKLSPEDLLAAAQACRWLRAAASDASLWRRLYHARWPSGPEQQAADAEHVQGCSWKVLYLEADEREVAAARAAAPAEAFRDIYLQVVGGLPCWCPARRGAHDDARPCCAPGSSCNAACMPAARRRPPATSARSPRLGAPACPRAACLDAADGHGAAVRGAAGRRRTVPLALRHARAAPVLQGGAVARGAGAECARACSPRPAAGRRAAGGLLPACRAAAFHGRRRVLSSCCWADDSWRPHF